jgi:hypothetical protein
LTQISFGRTLVLVTAQVIARWAGVVAGLVVAGVAAGSGALGRGLLLAGPLFGLCVVLGVVVGELLTTRPGGPVRSAPVETRRVRDYLPPWLTRAVAAAFLALVVLLAATTFVGSADDMGRPGRVLSRSCGDYAESAGAWAGSFYSVPLAVVVAAGALVAVLALRRIVRRPRPQHAAGLHGDDGARRQSAATVVGACGVLVAIPLTGVSVATGSVLMRIGCAPGWWGGAGWVLYVLVPVWLVLFAWSVTTVIFAPRPAASS